MQFSIATVSVIAAALQLVAAAPATPQNSVKAITIEDVVAQGWPMMSESDLKTSLSWTSPAPSKGLAARSTQDGAVCQNVANHCDVGNYNTLVADAQYLQGIQTCGVGGGPSNCIQTTPVGRDTAIWLCNDNSGSIAVSCSDVAHWALQVYQSCGQPYGQWFTNGNWNVIVAGRQC